MKTFCIKRLSHYEEGFEKLCEIWVKTEIQQILRQQISISFNHSPFINKEV